MNLFNEIEKSAEFSPCGKYRFMLVRKWDSNKPSIMFVGLNPSTANQVDDDPTIRRVVRFAKDWGYGCIYMLNLFSFVTPYPHELLIADDPLKDNDRWLEGIGERVQKIVFAWGAFPVAGRDQEVIKMFPNAFCLGRTKSGAPKHPLYIHSQTQLIPYGAL